MSEEEGAETTNRVRDWSRLLKNKYRDQLGELLSPDDYAALIEDEAH